jgi:2,3-diketo-5-methylthio-1-phosphopentane phosphatase
LTTAAQVPSFDKDGAPVSLLVDFDGTISLADVGDRLLSDLVADQELVARMDRLYVEGRKGSRELIAWDMEVLPHDREVLLQAVDALSLDETFVDLVATVREAGGAVEVVSDGIGFHVERMLASLGLGDLPIATNQANPGTGAVGVTFPFGNPACHVCGTCKRERIRLHQAAGRAVVFVGDGPSDRYAAHHADVIFAKSSLAAWCEVENVPYEPWGRLADVAEWIEIALLDGRLPADRSAFAEWDLRTRGGAGGFICGPEVWGEGRTIPTAVERGRTAGQADEPF